MWPLEMTHGFSGVNPPIIAPAFMERCYRLTPNGILTASDLGCLQCKEAMTTVAIRGRIGK